ncbi:hypothetical protein SACS_1593 [Parasaccharibacter apium]|uniref:Uncharacterized protein n=1 Tax=Parasaccharibacter apium TaxID=1510841 RepID=A0A7U7G728_9PROT|nr:hypothetical protein SACS_1593 [Parasaccharibacter apium]
MGYRPATPRPDYAPGGRGRQGEPVTVRRKMFGEGRYSAGKYDGKGIAQGFASRYKRPHEADVVQW